MNNNSCGAMMICQYQLKIIQISLLTVILLTSTHDAHAQLDDVHLSLGPIISLCSRNDQLNAGLGVQVTVYSPVLDNVSVHIRTAMTRFGSLHDDWYEYQGQVRELYYDILYFQLTPYVLYHVGKQVRLSIGGGMSYITANNYNRTVTNAEAIILTTLDNQWQHAYGLDVIARLFVRVSQRFAVGIISHMTVPIIGLGNHRPYISSGIGITYYAE